eukprot:scaffold3240_cov187-Amphora_coffeaeformis.AAC.1
MDVEVPLVRLTLNAVKTSCLATFGRRHLFLQQLTLVTRRELFVLSKGRGFPVGKREISKEFDEGINFGLASSKSSLGFCCRGSWEGHHMLQDRNDEAYCPEDNRNMSALIGFPIISSLVIAVKSYFRECRSRDLNSLFKAQYLSIDSRYLYEPDRFKTLKQPFSSLDTLQELLDRKFLVSDTAGQGMVWHTRELITTMLRDDYELAMVPYHTLVIRFAVFKVKKWHEAHPNFLFKTNVRGRVYPFVATFVGAARSAPSQFDAYYVG